MPSLKAINSGDFSNPYNVNILRIITLIPQKPAIYSWNNWYRIDNRGWIWFNLYFGQIFAAVNLFFKTLNMIWGFSWKNSLIVLYIKSPFNFISRQPVSHERMQKALSEGVQLAFCFRFVLVDEGGRIQITLFHWRADDCPTLKTGLVALWCLGVLEQYYPETLYFCDFQGGGIRTSAPLSGSAHVSHSTSTIIKLY